MNILWCSHGLEMRIRCIRLLDIYQSHVTHTHSWNIYSTIHPYPSPCSIYAVMISRNIYITIRHSKQTRIRLESHEHCDSLSAALESKENVLGGGPIQPTSLHHVGGHFLYSFDQYKVAYHVGLIGFPLIVYWQSPRRNCCRVLSSKGRNMVVDVGVCREGEISEVLSS